MEDEEKERRKEKRSEEEEEKERVDQKENRRREGEGERGEERSPGGGGEAAPPPPPPPPPPRQRRQQDLVLIGLERDRGCGVDLRIKRSCYCEIPRCCPSSVVNIMRRCWDANPEKSPEMDEVVKLLEAIDTSKDGGMLPNDQANECFCFCLARGP
ncbi:hypothetical protein Vadar_008379 [Vaccinium darrowii]|uniref:Uncharacterized protein n=1 Tax=Vaccinium darrowii TaxID=229202 RepID=A0ACB7WYZ0_9ERIC|nr:hypothetical protein Vadar_008379 [Vaccinium darrowii]